MTVVAGEAPVGPARRGPRARRQFMPSW
jgi:hypothetical protein